MSRTRRRFTPVVSLLIAGILTASSAVANECPSNLDELVEVDPNPPGNDYDIYYTTSGGSPDRTLPGIANEVRDATSNSHDVFVSPAYGFPNPHWSVMPNDSCIYEFPDRGDASARPAYIRYKPSVLGEEDEPGRRRIVLHELFHHVQYDTLDFDEYPDWGPWFVEGPPAMMEDKTFADLDDDPFRKYREEYVADAINQPNFPLTNQSNGYGTALFWTYFTERLGTTTSEPGYGIDAMRLLLENMGGRSPDSFGVLRDTMADLGSPDALEDFLTDYAVAVHSHARDLSGLPDPSRYDFIDESPYDCDPMTATCVWYSSSSPVLVPSVGVAQSDSVEAWGSESYQVSLEDPQACEILGVRAASREDEVLGWALVGERGDAISDVYRARGRDFERALVNDPVTPYTELALVASGLHDGAIIDYEFASGSIGGEIRLPTAGRKAIVGPAGDPANPPRRFLARLRATGPASLTPTSPGPVSVRGLDPTTFDVVLRSVADPGATFAGSTVLNAMYVDGEYWLTVLPPDDVDPGVGPDFDLEVCVCSDGASCITSFTSAASVRFEDETLHQVLTIDRSYSMHYPEPAETSKITAARNAARMFVDAAQADDLMGVVSFSGNDSECDGDGYPGANTGMAMVAGDSTGRGQLNADIGDIFEFGWTSIGDGLLTARTTLSSASGTPGDVRGIVLLSDGLENEEDFWGDSNSACGTPPVESFFDQTGGVDRDVRIDTVAFGSDADQALLDAIAGASNQGLSLGVSADPPAAPSPAVAGGGSGVSAALSPGVNASPRNDDLQVPNRLAHAYRTLEEDARLQDRLYFAAADLSAGVPTTFDVPVTEDEGGGIRQATFVVNWHLEAANVTVTVLDPSSSPVTGATPGWTMASDATHTTLLYDGVLPPGTWQIETTADIPVQAIAMVSGTLVRGVALDTRTSQVRAPGPNTECDSERYRYLRGLPVTLLANLTDVTGGLTGASVEARVLNPDGTRNTLVLYDDGAHDDSLPHDGVYGNVFTRTPFYSRGGVPDFPDGPPSGDWGTTVVEFVASGVSGLGDPYQRDEMRSFHVHEFVADQNGCEPDLDGDTLPDRWELLYGLDPSDASDALLDHDDDGLIATDEFKHGTLPLDPDTDDGGESDGSEVAFGRDPLYDADDPLPPILDYDVVTHVYHGPADVLKPGANLLRFPASEGYALIHVYRTDPSWTGFQLVASLPLDTPPRGSHLDDGLVNGFAYDYYLVAENLAGAQTARTRVFSGTPKIDPYPPSHYPLINHGARATGSRDVVLALHASSDATEMSISEDIGVVGASYLPLARDAPFTLAPGASSPFVAQLYARVRDASGNESILRGDSILVDELGDADGDTIPNYLDDDADGDGLLDVDEIPLGYETLDADSDADDTPDGDEDFDGDGLANLVEVDVLGTDPAVFDTDGDGAGDGLEVAGGFDPLDAADTPLVPGALGPGEVVVLNDSAGGDEILRIDRATGDRSVVTSPSVGTGPTFLRPVDLAIEEDGRIVVADFDAFAVFRVDPGTGDRTIVASATVGAGGPFRPGGIAVELDGSLLVVDAPAGALLRIDPSTGDRTVVASPVVGAGPNFTGTGLLLAREPNGRALVAAISRVIRVDLATGDREIASTASAAAVGSGPAFASARSLLRDVDGSFLLADQGEPAVFRVDPGSGDRTVVSSNAVGLGTAFSSPSDVWPAPNGEILVTDFFANTLFSVDPATGDRSVVSDAATGAGPPITGLRAIALQPTPRMVFDFDGVPPGSLPPEAFYGGAASVEHVGDFVGGGLATPGDQLLYMTTGPDSNGFGEDSDTTGDGTTEWDRATVLLPLDRGPNDPAVLQLEYDILTSELNGGVPDPVTLSIDSSSPPYDVMASIGAPNGAYTPVTAFGAGPITGPDGSSFPDGRLGFATLRKRVDIGPHAVLLDVADEADAQYDTAMLVDSIRLPEPGLAAGFASGLGLLIGLARRRAMRGSPTS